MCHRSAGKNLFLSIFFLTFLCQAYNAPHSCPFSNTPRHYTSVAALKTIAKTPGYSLLTGDFPYIQKDFVSFIHSLWEQHQEPIVELNIPFSQILQRHFVVMSPDIAQAILLDKSGAITKGAVEKRAEKFIFAPEGIIFMDANERWSLLNKQLFEGPLNPECFPNRYQTVFRTNFLWFVERLSHKEQPFELYREVTYYTMRTMTEAFFNYILDDEDLVAITDAFAYIMNFTYQRETQVFNLPLSLPSPSNNQFHTHLATFNTILDTIICQSPETIIVHGIEYPTMIGILNHHKDPHSQTPLTPAEIKSHVATIFFAAHDTTANFITMLIYTINSDPELYRKLQTELLIALKEHSFEWLPLGKLPYYTNVKNEVLRLYPSLPVITVDTTQDIFVDHYVIPKKSVLCIGIEMINTHPWYFKNPRRFNPDRFNPDNDDYTPHTNDSFITFNFGFRRCIGQWFAQAEAQSLIHELLLHDITFDLLENDCPVGLAMKMTGMPNRPIWVNPLSLTKSSLPHKVTSTCICDTRMEVIQVVPANEDVSIKLFRLAMPDGQPLPFTYQAGDHIELTITQEDGTRLMRHFSICSSPTDSDHWLEIAIKKEPLGLFSTYMHNKIDEGDLVHVRAPFYDGAAISAMDDPNIPLILISGGIGITPMVSITRYLLENHWQGDIYLVHSNKNKNNAAFTQELASLAKQHQNLNLIYTFTQSFDALSGIQCHTGRLNRVIFDQIGPEILQKGRIIICGKQGMCDELKNLLNKHYDIEPSSIHYLSFGGTQINGPDIKTYSLNEVAQHNKRSDAWLAIDGHVYDITNYIAYHPGFDIILDYIGTDASQVFASVPHSADAKKILNNSEYIVFKGFLREKN